MYGNISNPFPYIKSGNIFYLGSFHEAAPMVYGESMILKVPVLTTETCSAQELVGELGYVCPNTEEGIYQALKLILSDQNLLKEKKTKIEQYNYTEKLCLLSKLLKVEK